MDGVAANLANFSSGITGWSFGFGGFDSLMPAICVMLLALAVKIGSSYFPKRGHRAD